MATLQCFSEEGVEYRRLSADRWSYLPTMSGPQRAPDGSAMVSVLHAGDLAMVQLSVQLDPSAAVLERGRARIAALPGCAPSLSLEAAVTAVEQVEIVADPRGEPRILASSAGSGYPPYVAVFSLRPDGDDLSALEHALAGRPDEVEVRHHVVTAAGRTILATDIASWAGGHPSASASASSVARPAGAAVQQEGTTC